MANDYQWVWGVVPSPAQETSLEQLNTVLLGSLLAKNLLFFAGEQSIEDETVTMVLGFNNELDQARCSRLLGGQNIDVSQVLNELPEDFIFRVRLNQPDQGGIAEANYHRLSNHAAEIITVAQAPASVPDMVRAMGATEDDITLVRYTMFQEPDEYHQIDNVALHSEPERLFGIDTDPLLLAGEWARDLPEFLRWVDCRDDLVNGKCFLGEANAEVHH